MEGEGMEDLETTKASSDITKDIEREETLPPGQFGDYPGGLEAEVHAAEFASLSAGQSNGESGIDLLLDVALNIDVELGRSTMPIKDILALGPGSIVELDKVAGEPVDVFVNNTLIARGEVVVVDDKFGVRVTEIVSPMKRATANA